MISSKTLNIAIIHNNDMKRQLYLRPKLQELKDSLVGILNVNFEEYSFQSSFQVVYEKNFFRSLHTQLDESSRYFFASRIWERYKKNRNPVSFFPLIHQIIHFFIPLKCFNQKMEYNFIQSKKNRAIFEKHFRAWTDFLETKDPQQFLLVIEDDLIFTEKSIQNFHKICYEFLDNNFSPELPIFLDVAGGFKIEKLRVENLVNNRSELDISFIKPVTNTACGYILNYTTAEIFCNTISEEPKMRNFGPDWAMNMIFVKSENLFSRSICKHYQPPVFIHGSFANYYESSVQSREQEK